MRRLVLFIAAMALGVTACSSNPATTGKTAVATERAPLEPCHPGCFPAGTLVATPDGLRPIESIQPGELVMLVDADGTATSGRVSARFQTCNQLVDVQTESGNLLTTATQPLCLSDGGFRAAGELVKGDLIWQWKEGKRCSARIMSAVRTEREAEVYNLVVGESAIFIAGEFLARGKPPPVGVEPLSTAK
jgi:hypothetical protein